MRKKKANRVASKKSASNVLSAVAIVVACVGLSYPLLTETPQRIAGVAISMAASADATLTVSVPENQYNTLAQQLTVKQLSLQEREAELNAREARNNKPSLGEIFGFISFLLSVLLCMLIGLNFYLDSRRVRRDTGIMGKRFQVDLR